MNPIDPIPAASTDSTDVLLAGLVEDATPVRRLWSPRRRLVLWVGLQIALAAWILSAGTWPALARHLASPAYLVELVLLGGAAFALARAGLAAVIPGLAALPGAAAGGIALLGGAALLGRYPADTQLPLDAFAALGLPCAVRTSLLSLAPTLLLVGALYRGWPLAPRRAAAFAGLAGFLGGYALMRLLCPLDDLLHVAMWHGGAVALGTAATAAVGGALLSRRTRTHRRTELTARKDGHGRSAFRG